MCVALVFAVPTMTIAPRALGPAAITLSAAGAFAGLTASVYAGRTRATDRRVLRWTRTHVSSAFRERALRPLSWLSAPAILVSATLAAAAWVARRRTARVALPLALAPFAAMTAGQSCTLLLPARRSPDASLFGRAEPCYPSGHTAGAVAEALAVSYVCAREGLGSPLALAALPAAAALVGAVRVLRARHWITDVLAGCASGVVIAGLAAVAYECLRDERSDPTARGGSRADTEARD